MNLFWKKMFGKLQATAVYEKKSVTIYDKYLRYSQIEKSLELAEYKKLYEEVKSAEFQEKRRLLISRKYKDTQEFRDLKKFNQLQSDKSLQLYFETLDNALLNEFLEFKKTSEYELLGKPVEVKKSERLQRFKAFEKSKIYKNYVRFHGSFIVDDYQKIKAHVQSPNFVKENEFWANKNRWQTTEEYEREQKFKRFAENPDIRFYESIDPEIFANIRGMELSFDESFSGNTLAAEKWAFGFNLNSHKLMKVYSFTNEQQANTGGMNTSVSKGYLDIETKKRGARVSAWDGEKGFVERDFQYTSDVLHSKDFAQKGGVFSAKIRCNGALNHAFWLAGEKMLPHINIFHFNGKKITMGNATENGFEQVEISGINPKQFFVYTLRWTADELVWFINNFEVFRTKKNVPQSELSLMFNSFISQNAKGAEGNLQVDWVKVYKIK